MKSILFAGALVLSAGAAFAQVGYVDFDGTETGLTGYTNSVYTYAGPGFGTDAAAVSTFGSTSWAAGDSFWPMTRAAVGPNAVGMPFSISDDSVAAAAGNTVFANDVLGFAGMATTSGFFGVTDTVNSFGSTFTADFVFDISGASNLSASIDFAAMGDFETADVFDFEYSIDGGAFQPLFTSSVDDAGTQSYLMDSGTPVDLPDPVLINGILLNDVWQTLSAPISGTGTSLTLRFSGTTDGSEGFGFDNIVITPEPSSLLLLVLGGLGVARRR